MPTPDVSETLLSVGTAIGIVVGTAVLTFLKIYHDARSKERERVDASPTIATQAVAAGLVDKTSADMIVRVAQDVHEIKEIAERAEQWRRDREMFEAGRRAAKTPQAQD